MMGGGSGPYHGTENDCRFLNDCKAETKVRDGCLIVGILSSQLAQLKFFKLPGLVQLSMYLIRSLDFRQTWCTSIQIGLLAPLSCASDHFNCKSQEVVQNLNLCFFPVLLPSSFQA